MEQYLQPHMTKAQVDAISNLGLAHVGDGVYELLCRSYLCLRGDHTVSNLHRHSVELVKATTQARLADSLLPLLTPEELAYYRRGKNAHVHVPRSASPQEYAKATGLETLFGALYLMGNTQRVNELFEKLMEVAYGI